MLRRTGLPLALSAVLAFAGCGADDGDASAPCPEPVPSGDVSRLPEGTPLDRFGVVTAVEPQGKFLSARALSDRTVDALFDSLTDALEAARYQILSEDNEIFEAEIFFADRDGRTGLLTLREGPCDGQVTIKLVYG